MKKIYFLIVVLPILIETVQTTKLEQSNIDSDAADTFIINKNYFHKIFHRIDFITISIENRKLFSKILQLISANKSYFVINNKYCYNSIINVHTNYFINSYYENDELFARRRRKRAAAGNSIGEINKNLTYSNLINLNNKNYGGFIFEISNVNMITYIVNCYLTPGGTYLFIINDSTVENGYENVYDYLYEDYFLDNGKSRGVSLDDIATLFHDIWINHQNYKVFIYLNRKIITYNPFYYNMTVRRFGKLMINSSDSESDDGEFLSEINLKKLNGYPLKIELFPSTYVIKVHDGKTGRPYYIGADVLVSNTLQNVMNYTSIKVKADQYQFGYRLPNGSFTGTLNHLLRRSSDIALNGFFIKDYFTRDIEFTTGVYSDQLCLILKKADRIPSSLLPLLCFKSELWVMILLVMIGSSIFWCALRSINETPYFKRIYDSDCPWSENCDRFNRSMWILKHKYFQYYQIFMDTAMLMGSAPLRRFTKVTTERCFIITLCLISLVFVSIFQSKLATVFIKPVYYKDILTLNDMAKSSLKIGIRYPAMMDDMFPMNSTKLIESLRKKMYLLDPKNAQITNKMYKDGKLATNTRRSKVKLDSAIFVTNQTFILVPECPKTYNLAYVLTKDSVYLEPINDILLHLLNGGIINKWINEMYYNQTLSDIRTHGPFYVANFKTVTVSDLQLAFIILASGIVISTTFFVIELNISTCFRIFGKINKKIN